MIKTVLLLILLAISTLTALVDTSHAEERDTVTMVMGDTSWAPYIILPDTGQTIPQGLFVDLINHLFTNELNADVLYQPLPWKRAQRQVRDGRADIMITIPTPERAEYTLQTAQPINRMFLYLYTYAGHPQLNEITKIKTVEDIRALKLRLAAHIGDGWYKANIAKHGVQTEYISSDMHLPKFLAARRADGMIDSLLPMNHIIHKLGLESKIVITDAKFGPTDFYLLVGRKSPWAKRMYEIDAAMKRMQEAGIFDKIKSRHNHFDQ